jgi:hypothetical protein
MVGHVQLELEALYRLAQELVAGNSVDIDYSFDISIDSTDICVAQIQRGPSTYLLTVEGSGKEMSLAIRSTEICELLITLPAPTYLSVGEAIEIGDLC